MSKDTIFHCDLCNVDWDDALVEANYQRFNMLPASIIITSGNKRVINICPGCQLVLEINPPQHIIFMSEDYLRNLLKAHNFQDNL